MVATWLDLDLTEFVGRQWGFVQEPVDGLVVGRGDTAAEGGRGALLHLQVLQVLRDEHFLACRDTKTGMSVTLWPAAKGNRVLPKTWGGLTTEIEQMTLTGSE